MKGQNLYGPDHCPFGHDKTFRHSFSDGACGPPNMRTFGNLKSCKFCEDEDRFFGPGHNRHRRPYFADSCHFGGKERCCGISEKPGPNEKQDHHRQEHGDCCKKHCGYLGNGGNCDHYRQDRSRERKHDEDCRERVYTKKGSHNSCINHSCERRLPVFGHDDHCNEKQCERTGKGGSHCYHCRGNGRGHGYRSKEDERGQGEHCKGDDDGRGNHCRGDEIGHDNHARRGHSRERNQGESNRRQKSPDFRCRGAFGPVSLRPGPKCIHCDGRLEPTKPLGKGPSIKFEPDHGRTRPRHDGPSGDYKCRYSNKVQNSDNESGNESDRGRKNSHNRSKNRCDNRNENLGEKDSRCYSV